MPGPAPKKRILIVDDEMDMRIFISTVFKTSGFEAMTAKNGDEGFKAAEKESPDLIILDIMMPGEGGALMYKKLKSDSTLKSIPVIMVSAVGEETFNHYLTMLNTQADIPIPAPDAYIEKPPEANLVLETAMALLN
ncbi:MAG: response regulator [Desulfobacteraceae bacterium]|nr:response regulator [Desulfobacteraceae bacterium]